MFSSTNKSESVIVRGAEIEREIEKLEKAIKSSNNIQEQRSAIDMKNSLHQKAADYYLYHEKKDLEISQVTHQICHEHAKEQLEALGQTHPDETFNG